MSGRKVEGAGKTGPATLRQVRQSTAEDKNAKQVKKLLWGGGNCKLASSPGQC